MINRVTFTGVDNKTDKRELKKISEEYPFVEFGVLVSQNNTGSNEVNRFPDPETIRNLRFIGIPCSVHVCGALARNAVKTGCFDDIEEFLKSIGHNEFDRMQLNIRGFKDYKYFKYEGNIPIIIQVSDKRSADYYSQMHICSENVQALFDVSGGRGLSGLEGGFELGFDAKGYVGYAGGLNPDNVAFALGTIVGGRANKQVDSEFWIDMESGVRTDDWFDIEKVRQVCETVAPLIRK